MKLRLVGLDKRGNKVYISRDKLTQSWWVTYDRNLAYSPTSSRIGMRLAEVMSRGFRIWFMVEELPI
jgi:hypothetical protein